MSQQLRRGARQVLEEVYLKHKSAKKIARDSGTLDILDLLYEIEALIKEELEPMLQRASSNEPTLEARVRMLETKMDQIEPLVSAFMQSAAQHT